MNKPPLLFPALLALTFALTSPAGAQAGAPTFTPLTFERSVPLASGGPGPSSASTRAVTTAADTGTVTPLVFTPPKALTTTPVTVQGTVQRPPETPEVVPAARDIPASHWAQAAVSLLMQRGILTGYPDGTFRGAQPMTRYEVALILARLLKDGTLNTPAAQVLSNADRLVIQNGMTDVMTEIRAVQEQLSVLSGVVTEHGTRLDDLGQQLVGVKTDQLTLAGQVDVTQRRVVAAEQKAAADGQVVNSRLEALEKSQVDLITVIQSLQADLAKLRSGQGEGQVVGAPNTVVPVAVSAPVAQPAKLPDVAFQTAPASISAATATTPPRASMGIAGVYSGGGFAPMFSVKYNAKQNLAAQVYAGMLRGASSGVFAGGDVLVSPGNSVGGFSPYGLLGAGVLWSESRTDDARAIDPYAHFGIGAEYALSSTLGLFAEAGVNYYFSNKGVGTGLSDTAARGLGLKATFGARMRF